MHQQAFDFVARHAPHRPGLRVLDIGGRDMNGSPRSLFDGAAEYVGLDIAPGLGVDVVADAATWDPTATFDLVVCAEVLEHAPQWRQILRTAWRALAPGGQVVLTAAGPDRPPHSGRSPAPEPEPGEWYENVQPELLRRALVMAGFTEVVVDCSTGALGTGPLEDVRATARKPWALPQPGVVHMVTSVFGGYDEPEPPISQAGVETITMVTDRPDYMEEAGWPYTIRAATYLNHGDTDPRHAARWAKFLPHDALAGDAQHGDVVVWADGRVVITDPGFAMWMVDQLGDGDIAAWRHPAVTTMAQQMEVCLRDMPHKYDADDLLAHAAFHRDEYHDGIHQLTILATRINDRTYKAGQQVLAEMGRWRRSIDQAVFPYAVQAHEVLVRDLPGGQGGFWSHHGGAWHLVSHTDGT